MPEPVGRAASRDEDRQLAGLLAARISTGMVQLMSRFTGRGPTKARTSVNTNLVVVVFEQTLTKGELNLVRAGQGEGVASQRRTFQRLMREDAVALIERLTARKVVCVLGDTDPESDIAAMVFVLERQPETGVIETAEAHSREPQ
jgi:uncharacterized protein YbcI